MNPLTTNAAKVALALSVAALPAAANAGQMRPMSLIGQTVAFHILFGSDETTDNVVVTGKPEIECPGNFNACEYLNAPKLQTIDIGGNSITYRYKGPGAFFNQISPNAMDYEGLDLSKPIVGVELKTNIPGLSSSNVSFTSTSVQVSMSGLTVQNKGYYKLILQTRL